MRPRPQPARAGLTLIETLIATSLLVVVIGVPAMLLDTSRHAYDTSTRLTELDEMAQRAIGRVADRLETTGLSHFDLPVGGATLGTSVLQYRAVADFVAGAPVEGPTERLQLVLDPAETDDGTDEDGDGLIDERRLMWVEDPGGPDQRVLVLCSWVAESLEGEIPGNGLDDNGNLLVDEQGIVFVTTGDGMSIQLTLQRRDAEGLMITRTAQRVVAFRN